MSSILKFSNFDVYSIVRELDSILSQGVISNVYEIEDFLILKIKTKINQKRNLIIRNDSRINITNYNYPIPKFPSQYVMSLRKFIKNRKILSVTQHDFDRIVVFKLYNYEEEPWKFIIELFNKGNYILIDDKNVVKIANKYKRFKERDILPKKEYIFPKSRGMNFITLKKGTFNNLIVNSDEEIVRIMARNISISGMYSEEICFRAGIDKTQKGDSLTPENLNNLYNAFKSLRNQSLFGEIKAHIIYDENENLISVQPFDLVLFKDNKKKYFNSFNEAIDYYYAQNDSYLIKSPHSDNLDNQINSQEQILKRQYEYLDELKVQKKKYYEYGDFIYKHFNSLQKLFETVYHAEKKGYSLEEINEKLKNAKQEKIDDLDFFIQIMSSTKQLVINISNNEVYLNLKKSVGENANRLYTKGKKYEKKMEGTILAIEKTKEKIEQLLNKKQLIDEEVEVLVKKPRKSWFEKFRWFYTSDNFLVIGGRDASSNELIFRKYINSNDLIFHTNFPGSPLTLIKNPENKEIPKSSIEESANFVASYSRAWKENWGFADVFYVLPNQVSKTPPSGEFLPKGSFIISGKKNFIKDAKIELAIGLDLIEMHDIISTESSYFPKVVVGPINAIKSKYNDIIIIIPSNTGIQKGSLAKEIKSYFVRTVEKNLKKWVKLLDLNDIILGLPSGKSVIKK